MSDSNEFFLNELLAEKPARTSVISYGSDFFFLRAWGQRIEARLELLTPLHKWDMGVFRPDTTAERALVNNAVKFPEVIRPVWDKLGRVETEYRDCKNTNFKDTNELFYRFQTLEKTIRLACAAIENAHIAEMDFFELGEEILALLKEHTSVRDTWKLINDFEKKRRATFDIPENPEIWSGCDIRREPDKQTGGHCLVVVTGHPTIPESYHTAYIWDDQILDDSEEQELRDHISNVVSAWLRTGRRLVKKAEANHVAPTNRSQKIEPKWEFLSADDLARKHGGTRQTWNRHATKPANKTWIYQHNGALKFDPDSDGFKAAKARTRNSPKNNPEQF